MDSVCARALLTTLFEAAVAAAQPQRVLPPLLPPPPLGRTVVVGAGKGVAQLAQVLEQHWSTPLEGAVVTRYGHAAPCRHIRVYEAAHPVPDENGLLASRALMEWLRPLGRDDLVIALFCGGGSSLLPAPPDGISLADEQALTRALLVSGMPISTMNRIRRHCSLIKGGRLARMAHPARVVTLLVSDIPGDDCSAVASGPTLPDGSTAADALALLQRYCLPLPPALQHWLQSTEAASPQPDDADFADDRVHLVASAKQSLEAAAAAAETAGVTAFILSDAMEGEAREVAKVHAALAREVRLHNRPFQRPALLLSGGETTVALPAASGKGGRNSEFMLSLACAIAGLPEVFALAADSDGIDGSEDNAGAFADGETTARLACLGQDAEDFLRRHDSWSAFAALGDLFVPGPSGTNVNDFRALLIA